MTKERKLDLFGLLNKINRKQPNIIAELSEDEAKEAQPLLIMRWLSGTEDPRQVYFLNEVMNPYVFSLYEDKKLLIDLATICTDGSPQRYTWNKAPSKKKTSSSLVLAVVQEYFGYDERKAKDALPSLSNDDIMDYAEQLGRSAEEFAKIKKELK